jgi:hypothetical protein
MIRPEIIEEADAILLTGGEMPEVVMFESLAQLEAQGIHPTSIETRRLREAVFQRYQDMILRDLDPANRGTAVFRSPQRARINFARMSGFALKHDFELTDFLSLAAGMFQKYLEQESVDIAQGRSFNTLGMDRSETELLISELRIDPMAWADILAKVFAVPTLDWQSARKNMESQDA